MLSFSGSREESPQGPELAADVPPLLVARLQARERVLRLRSTGIGVCV